MHGLTGIGFTVLAIGFCAAFLFPLAAEAFFNREAKMEMESLKIECGHRKDIVREMDLENLPEPVQRWLKFSGIVGRERIRTVRMRQEGEMRLSRDKAWMPYVAEQFFTAEAPGFLWKVKVRAAPGIHITGMDKYADGRGSMRIRLMSLFTVADERGPEIDQGTMLRFLAESVWFPSAALSEYIRWEAAGENSAKAIMAYGGMEVSGVFDFNEKGEVTRFTAQRYRDEEGVYVLKEWLVSIGAYEEAGGFAVPAKAEVSWKLDDGDFEWDRLRVSGIWYDEAIKE